MGGQTKKKKKNLVDPLLVPRPQPNTRRISQKKKNAGPPPINKNNGKKNLKQKKKIPGSFDSLAVAAASMAAESGARNGW